MSSGHSTTNVAVTIEGIRCYAPALALGSEDYPNEFYDRLWRLEEAHFWFRGRNRIILRMFREHLAQRTRPRVLELGCGTGTNNGRSPDASICTWRTGGEARSGGSIGRGGRAALDHRFVPACKGGTHGPMLYPGFARPRT
jgi:hypothetical protein